MRSPTDTAATGSVTFDDYDQLAHSSRDAGAVVDRLIETLDRDGQPRELLEALLLKARLDLGLPAIQVGSLADLPEPARTQYEDRYVEAIRRVGGKLLDSGDITAAWPYFRAIAEREPIAGALDAYRHPVDGNQQDAERLSQLIDIAFQQGAHPRRGFELILQHHGVCSSITAFEHLPPDPAVRLPCVELLVRTLRNQLAASLRADIVRHGEPEPPAEATIPEMIAGRDGLFADDAYHIDVSHLGSVVRYATLATDPATLRPAVELAEYGRKLSHRYRYSNEPPFENSYDDYVVYLRGLLGEDVDAAVAHFRGKLRPQELDEFSGGSETVPAQVLVRLLDHLGRLDEAIDVAAEHLAGVPESMLFCPSLAALCQRAGRLDRLAAISRERNDPVLYVASILQQSKPPVS